MDAAFVDAMGQVPRFGSFGDPEPGPDEVLVRVRGAAITNLAKMIAAGNHYAAYREFPAVVGVDGVGELPDGSHVFFGGARAPFGAMAQWAPVPRGRVIPLPPEISLEAAAAVANPGLSARLTLTWRADVQPGQRVLILGATGFTGKMAVQTAKLLGAHVVAAGRNPAALERTAELGADETFRLAGDLREGFAGIVGGGFDVIVDYLWGDPAQALLETLVRADLTSSGRTTRFVQVGEMAGPTITLPAGLLRSRKLELLGHGTGTMPPPEITAGALREVFSAAAAGKLHVTAEQRALADVSQAWQQPNEPRIVLTPN